MISSTIIWGKKFQTFPIKKRFRNYPEPSTSESSGSSIPEPSSELSSSSTTTSSWTSSSISEVSSSTSGLATSGGGGTYPSNWPDSVQDLQQMTANPGSLVQYFIWTIRGQLLPGSSMQTLTSSLSSILTLTSTFFSSCSFFALKCNLYKYGTY